MPMATKQALVEAFLDLNRIETWPIPDAIDCVFLFG